MNLSAIEALKQDAQNKIKAQQQTAAQVKQHQQRQKDARALELMHRGYTSEFKEMLGDLVDITLNDPVQKPDGTITGYSATGYALIPGHGPIGVTCEQGDLRPNPDFDFSLPATSQPGIPPTLKHPGFVRTYFTHPGYFHGPDRVISSQPFNSSTRDIKPRWGRGVHGPTHSNHFATLNSDLVSTYKVEGLHALAGILIKAEAYFKALQVITRGLSAPHKLNPGDTTWTLGASGQAPGEYLLRSDELWLAEQIWPATGIHRYLVTLQVELSARSPAEAQSGVTRQLREGSLRSAIVTETRDEG